MMTVYLGTRETVYLNTEEVIREAFVKHGDSFAGRPQDIFWMKELCDGIGKKFVIKLLIVVNVIKCVQTGLRNCRSEAGT